MFYHRKETIIPVDVKKPDPRFGMFLLEQFGGATGELTAALQYWVQSFHITDARSVTCCRTSRSRNSAILRLSAS